jgi:hypothetical protein
MIRGNRKTLDRMSTDNKLFEILPEETKEMKAE